MTNQNSKSELILLLETNDDIIDDIITENSM